MLIDMALFLSAAVLFVPLFRRLGLGAVLGYVAAGIVIGPAGFGFITEVEKILRFAEYGIILLLFIIGLELQPSRLWSMRRAVFGFGALQVGASTALLAAGALALGYEARAAVVAGFGLAMSSTALVLQMLSERRELTTRHGRMAFAILLFQDLSVIPFLALVPLLASGLPTHHDGHGWLTAAKTLAVFAAVVLGGRYAVRPVMRRVAAAQTPELFTAAALLIVIGTALAMEAVGLSMSLGAFLAGVLLSESEYRHELQADIEPFKGLLLGLFFMAVGMSADLHALIAEPLQILALVLGLMLIKAAVLWLLARLAGLSGDAPSALAASLWQGGEFAFVLLSAAVSAEVLDATLSARLVLVVVLSMILTPPLFSLHVKLRQRREARPFDTIDTEPRQVLIIGFGPFAQIVARLLRVKGITYTVLDKDSEQVDFVRQFGNQVFYGDASRLDLLRAAHAEKAEFMVLAIPEVEASLHVAEVVRRNFPQLRIFAVAINRNHALRLMDLGVHEVIRRSYFSSLVMARKLLVDMGDTEESANHAIELFRRHDEQLLRRQHELPHEDGLKLAQTAREAEQELQQLFASDQADREARRA
ncbi:glutathione-regulated potassium-efflux system protein KefB [Solimonas aquatica]|uniref:Glutathione-regulated potassium-efflux system protein KefB n=1 Tax=Solimonas aquatica TaxID=489703 RepID=A0A1H9JRX0_9GAMM|nr:monovalent cation:proton antiporter-2 (CPA2) family protein [Solimonas aquatica]SEQ89731.1 glutathione-regulated potassium-efflux system protein KefB [Solimonas aquatica]